jgi:benzil reductase ((S)-benzoin forming)
MTSEGRIAIVTGSSSGIGQAVAASLVDRGWSVVGVSRRRSVIAHANYQHLALDLADVDATQTTFERRIAPLVADGRWTRAALVNNAASPESLSGFERIDPRTFVRVLTVNTVVPTWLMGFIVRHCPRDTALRIVNVSSGAAVAAYPGLAAYSSSKAALRMAGMVAAAELDSPQRTTAFPRDTAILSYQPGAVDTPMQTAARAQDPVRFPWVEMFQSFQSRGLLVAPEAPAAEIVTFLESRSEPRIAERRLQPPMR